MQLAKNTIRKFNASGSVWLLTGMCSNIVAWRRASLDRVAEERFLGTLSLNFHQLGDSPAFAR